MGKSYLCPNCDIAITKEEEEEVECVKCNKIICEHCIEAKEELNNFYCIDCEDLYYGS